MDNEDKMMVGMPKTEAASQIPDRISPEDKALLDQAQMRKALAHAQAEKAVAESETANLNLELTILRLYRKYGLSDADAFHPDGRILPGGAPKRAS